MTATDLYKAGKLDEAIAAQIEEVKAHPGDQGKRLFLFELLAFAGQWDKAGRQIHAIEYPEMELQAATLAYASQVGAEQKRQQLFLNGTPPQFLAEPTPQMKLRLEAVNYLRENKQAEASRVLAEADAQTPLLKGVLDDKPFEGLRDGDDLFGIVLEVFAQGNYFWVPLDHVESITIKPPRFPRDLIWLPARLETAGATGDVFLPVLYPSSSTHTDPLIRLGRSTDWKQEEGGPVIGLGLRTFLVGEDAVPLPEWRQIQINPQ
jgi:type VI secretion system protein ImpE